MDIERGVRPDASVGLNKKIGMLFDSLSPTQLEALNYLISDASGSKKGNKAEIQAWLIREKLENVLGAARVEFGMAQLIKYGMRSGQLQHEVPLGPYETLTPKEAEVCTFMSDGMSYKEIASELTISHRTVQTHSDKIRKKLRVGPDKYQIIARIDFIEKNGLMSVAKGAGVYTSELTRFSYTSRK